MSASGFIIAWAPFSILCIWEIVQPPNEIPTGKLKSFWNVGIKGSIYRNFKIDLNPQKSVDLIWIDTSKVILKPARVNHWLIMLRNCLFHHFAKF